MSRRIDHNFRLRIEDLHRQFKEAGYRSGTVAEFKLGAFELTARLERAQNKALYCELDVNWNDEDYLATTTVFLDIRRQPLGGMSTLFLCPVPHPTTLRPCGRRRRYLYLSIFRQYIGCRDCLGLLPNDWLRKLSPVVRQLIRPPLGKHSPRVTTLSETYQETEPETFIREQMAIMKSCQEDKQAIDGDVVSHCELRSEPCAPVR